MREIFGPALWPDGTRRPYWRLGRALLLAPLLFGALLAMLRALLAIIAGRRGNDLYAVSMDAFEASLVATFGFTATFGLAGIAALWVLRLRGVVHWAFVGGALGAAAGFLAGAANGPEIVAAALLGWAIFLAIRRLAGITA